MNLIPAAVTRTIARQGLLASSNAPSLLFGAGVIGSVASTVLACRATLKMDELLNTTQEDLGVAEQIDNPEYTEEMRTQDKRVIRLRSAAKVAKLYAPAVLLGAASIGCLTRSHNILQERNLALTAAYAAVDEAFKRYRGRVVEKYGEEEDRDLRFDTETVEIISTDDGKTLEIDFPAESNEHSMYARFFDQLSSQWSKEPEFNLVFLQSQQAYCNNILHARGHLFLNEVYDCLDLTRTRAGAVVGWVVSDDGDNYVDFGVFDGDRATARDFVNAREGAILLDFNVDGVIYDKIKEPGERLKWQS